MDNSTKEWLREIMQDVVRGYNEGGHMESRRVDESDVRHAQAVLEFAKPASSSLDNRITSWFMAHGPKPDLTPYVATHVLNAYLDTQNSFRPRVTPQQMYGLARRQVIISFTANGHIYLQGPSFYEAMLTYEITGFFS